MFSSPYQSHIIACNLLGKVPRKIYCLFNFISQEDVFPLGGGRAASHSVSRGHLYSYLCQTWISKIGTRGEKEENKQHAFCKQIINSESLS